jgi:phosphohistidine swiveling domain-containing protein
VRSAAATLTHHVAIAGGDFKRGLVHSATTERTGSAACSQPTVVVAESSPAEVRRHAGAKGCNLHRLTNAGISVPIWAVVSGDALRCFCQLNEIAPKLESTLQSVKLETVDAVAVGIENALNTGDVDGAILRAIEHAYSHVGGGAVAVRSSGSDEDGQATSFAGQYATFLNIVGLNEVVRSVRACWVSAYSARALRYRLLHSLPVEATDMAVVVQAMAPAEKSGVMFTVNPVSRRADEILISAAYGLGEGIVEGAIDADSIVIARDGHTKEVTVGQKESQVEAIEDGGVTATDVEVAARGRLSTTDDEIRELIECARKVEKLFGRPQDVEWALGAGRLWVLQSRPITTPVEAPPGDHRIWDNSNIIESFGDVTAPLTFSFARWAYEQVFSDHCQLIGLPSRDRAEAETWLPNMLGYFNGRVYYNLLNWYRLIGLLPFYGPHRKILEVSLGVSESLEDERAEHLRPLKRNSRVAELTVRARIAIRFVWYFATIELSVKSFLRHFYGMYAQFDSIDYSALSAEEVYISYTEAERGLLSRWGRMILLEAVLALSFGAMYGLTSRWLPDAPDSFIWEMARIENDVESAQPVERLKALAALVRANGDLSAMLHSLPVGREYAALKHIEGELAASLLAEIDGYLADFGYRNANELKLEEPDLREDPAALFGMLKDTLAQLDVEAERAAGESGEDYLRGQLRGPRLWAYKLVRRRVRRALRARESVRFCRTRTFGIARRMFRAMGEDMARFGALESACDVFYLRLEEIRGAFSGTIAHRELRPLVELRKGLEKEYRALPAPGRFDTCGTVYWGGLQREWEKRDANSDFDGHELRGVPCSAGVVDGEARVLDAPRHVGGGILVTYRTDPGWITALASASGLVIERGSPLTHVAVVARELGIPTVIQIPRVTERVRTGDRIRVDGSAGTVTIHNHDEDGEP